MTFYRDEQGARLPVKIDATSNGEFAPQPLTAPARHAVAIADERATANARKLHLSNVSFRRGDIEALPLEDASFDVVMSNCVVNLAPDKDAVFREAFRVLAPGGRLMVSDILLTRSATEAEMADFALRSGCISGSLPTAEYLGKLTTAGFTDVRVDTEHEPEAGTFWYSGAVSAKKPSAG